MKVTNRTDKGGLAEYRVLPEYRVLSNCPALPHLELEGNRI
jgi:hypothetical protein